VIIVGQVLVRNLDDAVIERHRARAKARGVSLEQELRDVLAQAAGADRDEFLAEMRRIRSANRPPPPGTSWPTAEAMVREDRDSR
jgi:plasmid stability protein